MGREKKSKGAERGRRAERNGRRAGYGGRWRRHGAGCGGAGGRRKGGRGAWKRRRRTGGHRPFLNRSSVTIRIAFYRCAALDALAILIASSAYIASRIAARSTVSAFVIAARNSILAASTTS